ncbi:hypothetical protein EQ831_13820 [Pseudomonas sp. ALS1279]|nr:hypothetical protein [Pseudomonas sp. ALS1279]TRO40754.1 hypothetical protein EQ831_13820 [Pseudomonas sp. ALS1279]
MNKTKPFRHKNVAQSATRDLELHTLGWKAFQDLCSQICEEVLKLPISIYREAQDGGQDAVFLSKSVHDEYYDFGTIQCKFTSKPDKKLRPSDLAPELDSIKKLINEGMATHYYFITNMSIDAPIAKQIRSTLSELGVKHPEVYGKEWITLKIRESARLRALVPRVYGLGDLSIILDGRKAEQTQALLGHLKSELKSYVPTEAHRKAVKCLESNGIVLLLGAPATGKSMIAAVLATAALDDIEHRCFQLDGPSEITSHWNPNEAGGFYWIDDAFGASQLRNDYVDTWISIMSKVKTAITNGNRFVLTSRQHVWATAKEKLGTRNHPGFSDGHAIVNVGDITIEERAQILYNHIKNGAQEKNWKSQVKPHLHELASNENFIPEIARRLSNPHYTEKVKTTLHDLKSFVSNPKTFLSDTINELDPKLQATLLLIFFNRSILTQENISTPQTTNAAKKLEISPPEIFYGLNILEGSFIRKRVEKYKVFWTFSHPTIADALSHKLATRPDLVEIYLGGAKIEELLSETYCEGAPTVPDAILIPKNFFPTLYKRLSETPHEPALNRSLFNYLEARTPDHALEKILCNDPEMLDRKPEPNSWDICLDPRIRLFARAHELGLLGRRHLEQAESLLEEAITKDLDSSFIEEDSILSLISPKKLMLITSKILEQSESDIADHIHDVLDNPDNTISPMENFDEIIAHVCNLKVAFPEANLLQAKIEKLEQKIYSSIEALKSQINQKNNEWVGIDTSPAVITATANNRSIFSDIDE